MNLATALPTGLLALVFLTPPIGEELAFTPEPGSTITRRFHETTALELDSMVRSLDGEEQEADEFEVEVKNEREFVFVDEYRAVGEERVDQLARTYETLSSRTEVAASEGGVIDEEADVAGTSALDGATVLFTWNDDEEEFEAAFTGDDADRFDGDLLDDLATTVDLAALLPGEEIAEGESWEVDLEVFPALFRLGGDVSLLPEIDPEDRDHEPIVMCFYFCLAEMTGELEGSVEATYDGEQETEDGEYAVISLELEVASTRDGLEAISELAEALELEEIDFTEMSSFEFRYSFDGEGTLWWDMEKGRAHRLILDGDVEISARGVAEMGPSTMEMEMVFAGRSELTVDVE